MKTRSNSFVSRETFMFLLVIAYFLKVSIFAVEYPVTFSEAVMISNLDDGSIYYERNNDVEIKTGNFTKLMTAYVALDYITEKKIDPKTAVVVSQRSSSLKNQSLNAVGGYYSKGENITYEMLFDLMLVANDDTAAVVLAESIGKTEADFVKIMNEKAISLGLKQTKYYNATGLTPDSYGDMGSIETKENTSTPREQIIIARSLINAYPTIIEVTSKTGVDRNGQVYTTTNQLLQGGNYEKSGVKGLITGNIDGLGSSLIVYYNKPESEEKYLISVFGSSSSETRFAEAQKMIDWTSKISTMPFLEDAQTYEYNLNGDSKSKREFFATTKHSKLTDYDVDILIDEIVLNDKYFNEKGLLLENIDKGEVVFTIVYKPFVIDEEQKIYTGIPKSIFNKEDEFTVNYVSRETIKKASFIQKIISASYSTISDLINNII